MDDRQLPPVEQYPGYAPPKAPFWTRRTVGWFTGLGGVLVGLFLGLLVGVDWYRDNDGDGEVCE